MQVEVLCLLGSQFVEVPVCPGRTGKGQNLGN
jgi:hypothetical protein